MEIVVYSRKGIILKMSLRKEINLQKVEKINLIKVFKKDFTQIMSLKMVIFLGIKEKSVSN